MIQIETKQETLWLHISEKEIVEVKKRINRGRIWRDIAVAFFITGCICLLYNTYIKNGSEWYYEQRVTFIFVFVGLVVFIISRHYEDWLPADVSQEADLLWDV